MSRRAQDGFNLIELMVVVAIVALLTMIAYPSYQGSVRKGQRSSAIAYLGALSQRQQQYFIDNRGYAGSEAALGYAATPADVLPYYAIAVVPADGPPPSYTITATPLGNQLQDSCGTLSVDSAGAKRAVKDSVAVSSCW